MSKAPKEQPQVDERTPFERFQQITRALFRVDKRDVLKHEPVKRTTSEKPTSSLPPSE